MSEDEGQPVEAEVSEERDRVITALYAQHASTIHLLALRLTGDRAAADEVVQDTFVRAWRSLDRFRGDSSHRTWLWAIACRVVHEARRTSLRLRRRVDRLEHRALVDYDRAVSDAAPGTRIDLERGIHALPAGARQVLLLHAVHGLGYQEIAMVLEISVGTVKSQIHRARHLLLIELDK